MLKFNNYIRAKSLEEAWQLNQNKRNRIIGGMLWLKMSSANIGTAIDICDLGLDKIEETEEEFFIGAMVSLRQLETHKGLNDFTFNAVREAVRHIVGVQFRNSATVGGSIFGRYGFSDVLTLFMATECYVHLYKGGIVPLEQFAAAKKDRDVLVGISVKKKGSSFCYKSMRNTRTDFPVIACAVSCIDGQYRAAIGARPSRAVAVRDTAGLLKEGITEKTAAEFAQYVADNAPTQSNVRGSSEYRTHLIKVLVQRSLEEMKGAQ